ncbi:hypothetical protein QBC38DRAFT_461322 [Podospora fimiseda]|uniref:Uncharacterized protein n=1 Tax=Podospora fimiseda TaxID=252190 RepID=A0AAN6YP46_9PEZI|nr:hypothetical protein QBC38DRAFT_461322 [Podospora fimiseda]
MSNVTRLLPQPDLGFFGLKLISRAMYFVVECSGRHSRPGLENRNMLGSTPEDAGNLFIIIMPECHVSRRTQFIRRLVRSTKSACKKVQRAGIPILRRVAVLPSRKTSWTSESLDSQQSSDVAEVKLSRSGGSSGCAGDVWSRAVDDAHSTPAREEASSGSSESSSEDDSMASGSGESASAPSAVREAEASSLDLSQATSASSVFTAHHDSSESIIEIPPGGVKLGRPRKASWVGSLSSLVEEEDGDSSSDSSSESSERHVSLPRASTDCAPGYSPIYGSLFTVAEGDEDLSDSSSSKDEPELAVSVGPLPPVPAEPVVYFDNSNKYYYTTLYTIFEPDAEALNSHLNHSRKSAKGKAPDDFVNGDQAEQEMIDGKPSEVACHLVGLFPVMEGHREEFALGGGLLFNPEQAKAPEQPTGGYKHIAGAAEHTTAGYKYTPASAERPRVKERWELDFYRDPNASGPSWAHMDDDDED